MLEGVKLEQRSAGYGADRKGEKGCPGAGWAYPRDGVIVEGDPDERGAAGGLVGKGERQCQEEGEGGQHLLAC